jgi:protein TonB
LKLVRRVAPKYPQSALLTRRQGTVMLRLTVGSNGRVKDAHVLSGDEDFAEAALNAVREWRYQPYRLDGKPVDVSTDAIITFSMTGSSNR